VGGERLAVEFALVLLHAAVIWGRGRRPSGCRRHCRAPRGWSWRLTAAGGWLAGAVVVSAFAQVTRAAVPIGPMWIALVVAGLCALALARVNGRMRRISQTVRLAVFFLALLMPAAAMYPSLLAHATEAKERLIATTFGPQAASLREDLQKRLQQAVDQIDAIPSLDQMVRLDVSTPVADPARAFAVWSRTDLATYRLTSAVELYSADGRLVSVPAQPAGICHDRISISGLQLGRAVRRGFAVWIQRAARCASPEACVRGRMVGSLVVRVMLTIGRCPSSRRRARISSRCVPIARSRPRASRGGTSSSSSTGGVARRSSSRVHASGHSPMPSSSVSSSRANRSGARSIATTRRSASISGAIVAASTRSAIP
jgi:hypothetical protein